MTSLQNITSFWALWGLLCNIRRNCRLSAATRSCYASATVYPDLALRRSVGERWLPSVRFLSSTAYVLFSITHLFLYPLRNFALPNLICGSQSRFNNQTVLRSTLGHRNVCRQFLSYHALSQFKARRTHIHRPTHIMIAIRLYDLKIILLNVKNYVHLEKMQLCNLAYR